MGIKLLESLEMQTGLPLDSRDIVTNIDQRNNIEPAVRYIGMEVYVSEENKKYRLEDGIENFNWKEIKAVANASELITDDDHLTVSKTEKETWSGKAEKVHTHTKKDITDFTHTHSKSEINDFPESLKNPSSLTIKLNGTPTVYDGSTVEEVNITPASIGAQPSGNYALATHNHDGVYQPKGSYANAVHTHTAEQVSGLPTSLKNPTSLSIQLNGGTSINYDGSDAKSINITATSIGAQPSGSYALSSHNHDGVYQPKGSYPTKEEIYTKSDVDKLIEEINSKFKNYPVPVGGVLLMYNNTNPAEVYAGTTWELLASDKYLKTTTGTPLSTGGSNSFTIQKANLPAVKIQLESFSVTTQPHKHTIGSEVRWDEHLWANSRRYLNAGQNNYDVKDTTDPCGSGGGANTGTASPYTQNLGNGTAISVNPTYITIRAWKRLS